MSEQVDLVDEHDRVVGSSTVKECLQGGLLHRAVAVLVLRRNGRLILQQRSKGDRWQPGLWTISSTGHVRKGERYHAAAKRELFEELGLRASPRRFEKYLLPPVHSGGLTEHEWVALYDARSDETVRVDAKELEGFRELSVSELRKFLAGGRVTPDAEFLLREYLGPAL